MIMSRVFSHILAYKVPIDDGVLQMITACVGPDDAIACIELYDVYGIPPPMALTLRLSNAISVEYILDAFSSKIHPYILQVHLSRPDVHMSIDDMDIILRYDDEYLWYMALSAYVARQSLPMHEIDILRIIGTRKAKRRLRDMTRREPSRPYDVAKMKRVVAGYASSSDPITPCPMIDLESRICIGHHHHMLYNRLIASITIFTMSMHDAYDVAWSTLTRYSTSIGKVEATILIMMMEPSRIPEVLHLLGPRTPCIVMGRIPSSYEHLVIRANVGHKELMQYIRTHDITTAMIEHILYRARNAEIPMEGLYYYAMGKMTIDDPMSEISFLEKHQINHRLRMIKKMGTLTRRMDEEATFTLGAEPISSIPDNMLMDIGSHAFSSSDLYKFIQHDIDINPYTRLPFDNDDMKEFITSLMLEGYPVQVCVGFDEVMEINEDEYDVDYIVDQMVIDNYLSIGVINYLSKRWDVSVLDIIDVINLARSSESTLDLMMKEMYPDAYKWMVLNTGV